MQSPMQVSLDELQSRAHVKIAEHSLLFPQEITWLQHSRLRHAVQGSSAALLAQVLGTTLPPAPPVNRPPPLVGPPVPLVPLVPLVPPLVAVPVPVAFPLHAALPAPPKSSKPDTATTTPDEANVFLRMW